MIHRLLIANRGEIAVRIAAAARERGVASIAVYSEADRDAFHTRVCDEAVWIGPAEASASYLSIPAILDAARRAGADAIHPGYGFLSEDPRFAQSVADAGLIWVGPSPESIETMGNKIAARELMERAGVPVVPGFQGKNATNGELERAAAKMGYPVIVKAAAGGGGKGMRSVSSPEDLFPAVERARREAQSAFGDGTIYLEKEIERPRHVEFQVFGDRAGNVVSLFERECSIQRRHQKILEETPSPALGEPLRRKMAEAAEAAARAVGYRNAGTVEFLVEKNGGFHFLEMNTRLQVEHAITEETLGIDLVGAQLDEAQGGLIPEQWRALRPRGHSIECRICAEDSETFLPRSGRVLAYEEPKGPGVRVDSGIAEGSDVGIEYDPLLAKVIVFAHDRTGAIQRMRRALSSFVILGVETNLSLLQRVVESSAFERGETDTAFLSRLPPRSRAPVPEEVLLAAAWEVLRPRDTSANTRLIGTPEPWESAAGWRGV